MHRAPWLTWFMSAIACASAQNMTPAADGSFSQDPILFYRPNFARSFPVQILMTGILLSLTVVLLLHLLFTVQYHWPMGRTNYILQVSSVCTLLISLVATLVIILQRANDDSSQWPYMIFYLSVNVPPSVNDTQGWSSAQTVAWYALDAATSGLVQITHVQFLTFLYPSHLEAKLIFGLLAPLTLVSTIMDLLLSQSPSTLASIAEDTRNICTSALSLLFTVALFLWGLVLHRPRSSPSKTYPSVWRTDGGTAAFGVSALFLAVMSTTINIIYIPSQDHYSWMRQLIWTVTLWQSFLGWWWWVGAGVGSVLESDTVMEKIKRQEKRMIRQKLKLARKEKRKERVQTLWREMTGRKAPSESTTQQPTESEVSSLIVPTAPDSTTTSSMTQLRPRHDGSLVSRVWSWWSALRQAHLSAAHAQAREQNEIRQQVYGNEVTNATVAGVGVGRRMSNFVGALSLQGSAKRRKAVGPAGSGDEWEMGDMTDVEGAATVVSEAPPEALASNSGTSLFWWGPLRQWRLQDATSYPPRR